MTDYNPPTRPGKRWKNTAKNTEFLQNTHLDNMSVDCLRCQRPEPVLSPQTEHRLNITQTTNAAQSRRFNVALLTNLLGRLVDFRANDCNAKNA